MFGLRWPCGSCALASSPAPILVAIARIAPVALRYFARSGALTEPDFIVSFMPATMGTRQANAVLQFVSKASDTTGTVLGAPATTAAL
jgi:hypothetical protein